MSFEHVQPHLAFDIDVENLNAGTTACMADISKLSHFSSSCSAYIDWCMDTIMAACLQRTLHPGYVRWLQTVITPMYFGALYTRGQETWYYKEGRDSCTCMKYHDQWKPFSDPSGGMLRNARPGQGSAIHFGGWSYVNWRLHVLVFKRSGSTRKCLKTEKKGENTELVFLTLLCVCTCSTHRHVSKNTCSCRFICVYLLFIGQGWVYSLIVPPPYFLSQCLSLNLELTNRLAWLSNELSWSALLMTDYLNWGPEACIGSVLQAEFSFYKWTIPSVWLFSETWRILLLGIRWLLQWQDNSMCGRGRPATGASSLIRSLAWLWWLSVLPASTADSLVDTDCFANYLMM